MKKIKVFIICVWVFCLGLVTIIPGLWAQEYKVTIEQIEQAKKFYDDPSPILEKLSWKKILPPEDYAKLTYDVEAMRKLWAEVVGFRAPNVVGKIAPEIKPGKYNYKDKEKFPGLKELMIPMYYEKFKPGAPPLAGNFQEIEVVPTRQYYYALPIAETTKKYVGQVKLDNQGYLIPETYVSGLPFPRPSGKFKAQEIMYNWDKRYFEPESGYLVNRNIGLNGRLIQDFESVSNGWNMRLKGRVSIPPIGWFDEMARKNEETKAFTLLNLSPRDQYGNVVSATNYDPLNKYDQMLVYVNAIRRVRRLSGTDSQDTAAGSDAIYEDAFYLNQKLSPNRFPYKYELIAEREYLIPAWSVDGSEYFRSAGKEMAGLRFERRPMFVVKLTQLDRAFVYGSRIIYFDAETLHLRHIECYNQKGRLYRSIMTVGNFAPEAGQFTAFMNVTQDHIDYHTSLSYPYQHPATWVNRDHVSLMQMIKKGK